MSQVQTAALPRAKSALKNLTIPRPYLQRFASAPKDLELVSFMTRQLVTPDDENGYGAGYTLVGRTQEEVEDIFGGIDPVC
jgi:hypothetical protein